MIIYFDPKGTKNQFYIGTIVLIIGLFFLCVLYHKNGIVATIHGYCNSRFFRRQ